MYASEDDQQTVTDTWRTSKPISFCPERVGETKLLLQDYVEPPVDKFHRHLDGLVVATEYRRDLMMGEDTVDVQMPVYITDNVMSIPFLCGRPRTNILGTQANIVLGVRSVGERGRAML